MKAVKRATCVSCSHNTNTTDGKTDKEGFAAKLKCPKCGSQLKLSSQWYARGQHNGKPVFQPCGSRKADAEDYIAACRLAKRNGTVLPGQEKDIPWQDAIKNCKEWMDKDVERGKLRQSSRDWYGFQFLALEKHFLGTTLLTITKASVETMMDTMSKTHAPASVASAVKTLKRIYALHTKNLDLEETPRPKLIEKEFVLSKIELPVVDNIKTVSATEVDLQTVLAAIDKGSPKKDDKQRLRLAIMMGVGMLMRPINIAGLEWNEVDFQGGVIRIAKEKMKGGRDFEQAIPGPILDELKAWRERREAECMQAAKASGADELQLQRIKGQVFSRYVFPSPKDTEKPTGTMCRAIRHWIKESGINPDGVDRKEKITPYVLTRHTGATQLYEESGENLEMVSKTADHADSRITRKRYVKNRVEYAKRTVIPLQEAMLKRMVGA